MSIQRLDNLTSQPGPLATAPAPGPDGARSTSQQGALLRALFEAAFDVLYLAAILLCGVVLLICSHDTRLGIYFGAMAVILGLGDAFHLLPRVRGLLTGQHSDRALGLGKWITSLTSCVYYVLLFEVWCTFYNPTSRIYWRILVWYLAALRLFLCCLPRNRWLQRPGAGAQWSLVRNIPFVLLGLVVAFLYGFAFQAGADPVFKHIPAAIAFSFACYIPVVLFGEKKPMLGMLMMPKTLLYLWIQYMGVRAILG